MTKRRQPLQVSDKFLARLKDLQRKIRMGTGDEKSLRDLTDALAGTDVFEKIAQNLTNSGDIKMDIKVKFDKRWLQ